MTLLNLIEKLGFIPDESTMTLVDVAPDVIRQIKESDLANKIPMEKDFLGKYCRIDGYRFYCLENTDYLKRVGTRFFTDEDFREELSCSVVPYVFIE